MFVTNKQDKLNKTLYTIKRIYPSNNKGIEKKLRATSLLVFFTGRRRLQ